VLQTIRIENYKSIERLTLPLGRMNVLIGENGAGKSNVLEAIALAGAAQARKLDNEFLASRGIRVSSPDLMRSAFNIDNLKLPIRVITSRADGSEVRYELTNENRPYSSWVKSDSRESGVDEIKWFFQDYMEALPSQRKRLQAAKVINEELVPALREIIDELESGVTPVDLENREFKIKLPLTKRKIEFVGGIENFLIYSPEHSMLRIFESESQIEPLGIRGEGTLKLLSVMANSRNKKAIDSIKESLRLVNWFKDFRISGGKIRNRMEIVDQFLDPLSPNFDQGSVNEGFLYLAFYFSLFSSDLTPSFFAVDNIDSSLNPKLCEALMARLVKLSKVHGKQVIFTTHNPAILDGLDLTDPEQRLFVVSRGSGGQTRIRRFQKKPSDEHPRRLSELFISGALGGLPKRF
jgi:predicted ATPase